jgi:hypothetical protein
MLELMRKNLLPVLVMAATGACGTAQINGTKPLGGDQSLEGFSTNGAVVFKQMNVPRPAAPLNSQGNAAEQTNSQTISYVTNLVFDHFLPRSLNQLVWTNLIAHTNGRSTSVWSVNQHPTNWPKQGPIVAWDTNGLMWGMKGLTALSPCWTVEGAPGQVPVTALTRRHGYTRGHSMGPDGINTNWIGQKVWFVTTNNTIVEATVARGIVRLRGPQQAGKIPGKDYTILSFTKDLPASIQPMRVTSSTNVSARYPTPQGGAPWPVFKIEQTGHVSAELPGLTLNTWKGGDSGSANMLPLPGELVFFSGRSTSGPDEGMQEDMDQLSRFLGIDQKRYQMQWVDLSQYPAY